MGDAVLVRGVVLLERNAASLLELGGGIGNVLTQGQENKQLVFANTIECEKVTEMGLQGLGDFESTTVLLEFLILWKMMDNSEHMQHTDSSQQ